MKDLLLAIGLTLRLTRFVTSDWLGHWWIVQPARRWALRESDFAGWESDGRPVSKATAPAELIDAIWDESKPDTGRKRLVKGLDCPHCFGFHAGVAVLLSLAIVRAVPPLLPVWRFVAGAFSLNYLVFHVSSRIDG